ncbi:MAG: YqeG family HAD IIIA-type phosphatase [Clostridia bacterium]|nr:YqeG family HAD IIIA-type phosphatase [Clostridia bacterium]
MPFFAPDFYFETYAGASVPFLKEQGIRALVLDIDNTLEPYENAEPSEGVRAWFAALAEAGISAAFVSNNDKQRVDTFNATLGLIAYSKAKKPFAKKVKSAMKEMGVTKESTLFMGDQIFTDVLAARLAGIRVALVPPIKDKTDALTRFKRWLERPIMKRFFRRNKK